MNKSTSLILFFINKVCSVCPLQQVHEQENVSLGMHPKTNSFHSGNGTAEIGGYGKSSSFSSSSFSKGWNSENMGAVERAGMSRSDKESIKNSAASCESGSGMGTGVGVAGSSSSAAAWSAGNIGASGQTGMYKSSESPWTSSDLASFRAARYSGAGKFGKKSLSSKVGSETPTFDPSGVSWGSEFSGVFGIEGMHGTRGSSWKSGNTGAFGQIEILEAEGPAHKQTFSGAFGNGELFNSESYLAGRGMHNTAKEVNALANIRMAQAYNHPGMGGSLSRARMFGAVGYPGMYGALASAKYGGALGLTGMGGVAGAAEYGAKYGAIGYGGMYGALAAGMQHKAAAINAEKALDVTGHGGIYGLAGSVGNRLSVTGHRTQTLLDSRGYPNEALFPLHSPYLGFRNIDADIY